MHAYNLKSYILTQVKWQKSYPFMCHIAIFPQININYSFPRDSSVRTLEELFKKLYSSLFISTTNLLWLLHLPPACSDSSFILFPVSLKVKVKSFSHVRHFATPWTVAHQAPLSIGSSRQECWSGLPFLSPGDLPNPGTPALQADYLPSDRLE